VVSLLSFNFGIELEQIAVLIVLLPALAFIRRHVRQERIAVIILSALVADTGWAVVIPLFVRHRILSQVAGHHMNVIKLLPPLCISQDDEDWIVRAFDDVIGECHKLPGAVWDLATTLASHALKARIG
jgi:hypothetical protein